MDTVQRLITAAVLALAGTASHAGYAQAVPPPGFQPMPAAGPVTQWGYAKAVNDTIAGTTVRTSTALNVGGRTVTMPAAMRFASNAPRFAAAVLFANPYLRAGTAAAAWLFAAKLIYDEADKAWKVNGPSVFGDCTLAGTGYASGGYWISEVLEVNPTNCRVTIRWGQGGNNEQRNDTVPRSDVDNQKPLTKEEFEKEMAPEVWRPNSPGIVPENWPDVVPPGVPLPVELPVINPAPGPLPETPAAPRPLFEPSGDPVPNPNYNPNSEPSPANQPYIQPGIKIQPSPTITEPWRVDVQPVTRPDSDGKPDPQPDPETQPDPQPDPNEKPKPEEQQQLCEKFPDILACQKLDTPEAQDLSREQVQISISPLGGWGAEDAACPAPKTAMVMGREVSLSWQPVCDFATGLRPLVIALAWLSAATMLIVVARRGNA